MRITRLGFFFFILGLSLAIFFYGAKETDITDTVPQGTGNFFLDLKNKAVHFNSEVQNTVHETVGLFVVQTDENIQNQKLTSTEPEITTEKVVRDDTPQPTQALSAGGVISRTNYYRRQEGLPPLTQNAYLTASAQMKVDDMFAQQYFEHESPSGVGSGDLARLVGYAYLIIGENLALGDYENDFELVEGWMDSPGHRDNILNPQYKEIGVAIKEGVFEGETVWLAVQEFGRPTSDCPDVSTALNARIKESQQLLIQLQQKLADMLTEINTIKPAHGSVYSGKVDVYNALVHQYNLFVEQSKKDVATYNAQVRARNTCVQE